MLTQLLPDQISKFWPIIKYAVEEALPPTTKSEHPDKMSRILSGMLCGKLDVWASYKHQEDGVTKFEGIVITQILYDDASNVHNLLIYALYAYENTTPNSWMDGYKALAKYAKAKRCSNIVAYASVPSIISLANRLGADTSFTFISFPLSQFNG
jgi:hypothetical protein